MTAETGNITVHIKYKDVETTFFGTLENVWLSLGKFFNQFLPSFDIVNRLMLNVDLQQLAKESEEIIAFSHEGPNLLVQRGKLTDNETLELWLLASYVGHRLGLLKGDARSKEQLQARLGKSAKITSTRLGELIKDGIVARAEGENYKITTFGIVHIQKEALPRIRARIRA